jgi:hypothetical protein
VLNLLALELVIIGGDPAGVGGLLLDPVRQVIGQNSIRSTGTTTELLPAQLGARAEVLGAVELALAANSLAGSVGSWPGAGQAAGAGGTP